MDLLDTITSYEIMFNQCQSTSWFIFHFLTKIHRSKVEQFMELKVALAKKLKIRMGKNVLYVQYLCRFLQMSTRSVTPTF